MSDEEEERRRRNDGAQEQPEGLLQRMRNAIVRAWRRMFGG